MGDITVNPGHGKQGGKEMAGDTEGVENGTFVEFDIGSNLRFPGFFQLLAAGNFYRFQGIQ